MGSSDLRESKGIVSSFNKVSPFKKRAKSTRSISIRFTDDELEYLREKAGKLPLSTFCRGLLLGSKIDKGRAHRQPKVNQKELATVLAALGQSRLPSNLNQLAKSANMGTLDISEETEQKMLEASRAVIEMRRALMMALSMKV